MNKNRKRVTGRVIATACTGLMLMQGVVTPTVLAAELPGSAIEANAYSESGTFTLDSTVKKIKLYETVHLQATLNSKNVEDRFLKWECDNANVANVSNGYITGMNTGRTNITVTYLPTGETAHCQLTVGTIPGEDGNEFKLDSSEKKIKLYETIQLKALAGDDVVQDRDLKWESSNKDVANVNNGYVTGMNNGKTTITVTYVPSGLTATCELTVGTIPGENGAEFKIDSSTKAIRLWETVQLKAMAGNDVMADKDIKWESSNPSVATVNNGYVSGISVGTTTIKATYLPTGLVATCEVAVSKDGSVTPEPTPGPGPEDPDPIVNPEVNFTLDANVKTVKVGKTNRITAKVDGKNASMNDLEFTVDKPEVATVNNMGVITGVAAGKAKVTVTYKPTGQTAVCQIAVEKDQETPVVLEGELVLDKKVVEVEAGKTAKVTATIGGKEVPSKDLKWTADKTDLVVVRNDGVILGVKEGKAKVTVTYVPTGKTASVEVVVKDEQAQQVDFTIDAAVKAVKVGKTTRITAKVDGKNANLADLEFTVDKPEVATVNNMGVITGVAAGKAKVTVTYKPTGQTAVCQIAVEKDQDAPVVLEGEVAVDKKVVALKEGETTKVVATVGGKTVDKKDLKFVSDKTDVAIVRNDGTILGRKAGKAKVTVTYVPTGKTAEVMVAVEAKKEVLEGELALDQKVVELEAGKTTKVTATINGKEVPRTDLKWTADKSDIVVLRNDGVILGAKAGKAVVTVTYVPTGKTASFAVVVKDEQAQQVDFTIDAAVKAVKVGKTTRITAKVDGKNANLADLEFTVDKPEVATVNNMGVITGVAAGKAKVTVTYKPTGQTAVCQIAVEKDQETPVVLEGELAVDKKIVELQEGEGTKVVATVGGKSVNTKDLKFVSNKTDVAIVRNDGTILGLKAGKASVTVTYVPTGKTATVMVAVEPKKEVLAGEISLDKTYVELQPKELVKVTATINGKEIPSADYQWTTSDPNVATVKGGGILAAAPGKATITVTYKPTGKTASVEVVVKDEQAQTAEFALDAKLKVVKIGKTNRITAKVDGKNANLADLEFSVDKPEVATVNNMGVITGVAAGKAVVTVTYKPTGQTAVCQIAVEKETAETGITVDSKIKQVDAGKTTRVLVKVNGQNAPLADLAFSMDRPDIATVNSVGVITGVKTGRCVLTVTYRPTGESVKVPVSVH